MAHIVIADDGISFDGQMKAQKPLGGAESALVCLAEALAARGHRVTVHNRCAAPLHWAGVDWVPLVDGVADRGVPQKADLYIANRSNHLIGLCPQATRCVFWIHNPAGYLMKLRYQWPLWRRRPDIVFSGPSHMSTYPRWGGCGRRLIIPYGIDSLFLGETERSVAPPPRAIFLSNPLRSLDWLLDVWCQHIHPHLPQAELHVFAGAAVYGKAGDRKADRMTPILEKARQAASQGVVLNPPVPKQDLLGEIRQSRLFLYRGDVGETFCLAAGDTQAMGLPGVVEDIACMKERIRDGETGFVVKDEQAFAKAALRLLQDDDLWWTMHRKALAQQGQWGWPQMAEAFEAEFL